MAMTVESCVSYCANLGYQYAGVEYYQECCMMLPHLSVPALDTIH